MGFVTLGLAVRPRGVNGAIHDARIGTISAMLFMLVGVIYDRAHHRDIDRFGGPPKDADLRRPRGVRPLHIGLGPRASRLHRRGDVFFGSFKAYEKFTLIATIGMVITAAYYLITLQKVFLGDAARLPDKAHYLDVSRRELLVLVPSRS
jgi:NADH-quinone oxidoreductase subunit M